MSGLKRRIFQKIVKTDTRGHYVSRGLAVGTYKVTLVINGQVKGSILNTKTQVGKATQLNFDLTGKTAPAKQHTHIVYVPPDIDSHIGVGGRWVELDDNGKIVNPTGASSNVETVRGTAVQATQIKVHAGGGN
jgi:hypothetical protein